MEQLPLMHSVNNGVKLDAHSARRVLISALFVAAVADLLLRATPWGLNVWLVVLLLVVAAYAMSRWAGVRLDGEGRWLALGMAFFAFGLVWRDSPTLNVANSIALLTTTCLAALTARDGQLRRAGVSQYAQGVIYMLGHAAAGLLPTLRTELPWRSYRWAWWSNPALAVGRGVLLALPPLVLFGGLFVAADANFEKLVDDALAFDIGDMTAHTALIVVYAWLVGGTLREMLLGPLRSKPEARPSRVKLGVVEVAVVIALLDALFFSFVAMQLPYLFGGLRQVAEMGYSEYARRGFFELVWVAGLTLPLLLVAHWLLREAGPLAQRVYRVLAFGLVALLFVIMASAVQRMQLYVGFYGVTELRVQASALMGWLAIVLVWFVVTVLRNRRRAFAFGALLSAMAAIGALDFVNPDALIVRTNAEFHHLEGQYGFDERPLASLSADATPAIVDALPQLSADARTKVITKLERRYASAPSDWRSFNVSREQAQRAVEAVLP
jgi:hypothetical protein